MLISWIKTLNNSKIFFSQWINNGPLQFGHIYMDMVALGEHCSECMMILIKIVEIGEEEPYWWNITAIEIIIICIIVSLIEHHLAMPIKLLMAISHIIDGTSLLYQPIIYMDNIVPIFMMLQQEF